MSEGKRILAIDGGGIKGYSQFLCLLPLKIQSGIM